MTEISTGQMKLLHVLAKQAGISHAELSASGRKMFGVSSLNDLEFAQAGEMIDGLQPAGSKMPEEPKKPAPLYTRFPRRGELLPKPRPTEKLPAPAPVQPAPAIVPRPRPPMPLRFMPPLAPAPKPAVPLAGERSSGGFGRMLPVTPKPATAAPAAPRVYGEIDPNEIPY